MSSSGEDDSDNDDDASSGSGSSGSSSEPSRFNDELKLITPTCPRQLTDFSKHIREHTYMLLTQLAPFLPTSNEPSDIPCVSLRAKPITPKAVVPEEEPMEEEKKTEVEPHLQVEQIIEQRLNEFSKNMLEKVEKQLKDMTARITSSTNVPPQQAAQTQEPEATEANNKILEERERVTTALKAIIEEQNGKMKEFSDRIESQEAKLFDYKKQIEAIEENAGHWEVDSL